MNRTLFYIISCWLLPLAAFSQRAGKKIAIATQAAPGSFPLVSSNGTATVYVSKTDAEVVQIAATAFSDDVRKVTDKQPVMKVVEGITGLSNYCVIAGTLGNSALIDSLAAKKLIPAATIAGKWETFSISLVSHPFKGVTTALVIAGSDRRATAFGLFELSAMMGVQPFNWWADIVPAHKQAIYVTPGEQVVGPPSVKYRGIFINDEDWGLQPWAANNIDTALHDIGPHTYAKVFELLLRLKANYIWPAMHPCTKAFWYYKENPVVANKYAIILGASHCEPMLRDNIFEWTDNFTNEYGTKPGEWRYDVNKQQIYQYWDDRVKESVPDEAVYTVGMRGIHDGSMPGPAKMEEKVTLLEQIIRDQKTIISTRLQKNERDVPQIFCPYKEVLDIYQAGMKLPDDVTIVWADDNHGYIRQLSTPAEQQRSGHSGVYYHLSYWGAPRDYLWLSTISPSLVSYEMTKAYQYGADRLWIFNVGDIKPAEMETQFALELAWNVAKWTPEKAYQYPRTWAATIFGEQYADAIAAIKQTYYRLAAAGKPEHILDVSYTEKEMQERLDAYHNMVQQVLAVKKTIPARLKDAFFELIEYPATGAMLMNEKIFYARKSMLLAKRGDTTALRYAALSQQAYNTIQAITAQYNEQTAGGKWKGIISSHPRDQKVFTMPPVATQQMMANRAAVKIEGIKEEGNNITIAAAAYTNKKETGNTHFQLLEGLGCNGKGMHAAPFVRPSVDSAAITTAPYLEYTVTLDTGMYIIQAKCLPTFRMYEGLRMRYGLSVNRQPAQVISIETAADTPGWGKNVLQGYAQGESQYSIIAKQPVTIRVYFPDPGFVLNELQIKKIP